MTRVVLCVMAKAPVAGSVKTRLSPPLSAEAAAELAAAFLVDTWTAVASVASAEAVLAWSGPRSALPAELTAAQVIDQPPGDLGRRMATVAATLLGRADAVVLVGSDLPGLPATRLNDAIAALDSADAVLGKVSDGGYYLIGLRRAAPDLLDDLPWSRADTLAATRARLVDRGYEVADIDAFDDVDDADDLARLQRGLATNAIAAPATQAVIESWTSRSSSRR